MRSEQVSHSITIPAGGVQLQANLIVPRDPCGVVIFVHGSGSSRFSRRNRYVANTLVEKGFATLLADLLTPEEEAIDERTAELRFNIDLLAERTVGLIDFAASNESIRRVPVGLFGASTGAAAAVIAAVSRAAQTKAVVSRGGRVDLAGHALEKLETPLLMIVGELDAPVINLHRQVLPRLRCAYTLEVIPEASHLFEEPGALEVVSDLAGAWFERYLLP